jgi:hypothetical protein
MFRFWPFKTIWLYHVISHTNLQLDRKTAGRAPAVSENALYTAKIGICVGKNMIDHGFRDTIFSVEPIFTLLAIRYYARRGREPIVPTVKTNDWCCAA